MEEKIAELTAKIAELEASSQVTNTMFAETYYYLTIPLMVLIHAGFLAYEMGATRVKNVLSSGVKNILAFAFVIPAFYFFGWWVYWAFPTGISLSTGPMEISGKEYADAIAWGWGESAQFMGPNIADNASGVFWGGWTSYMKTPPGSVFDGFVLSGSKPACSRVAEGGNRPSKLKVLLTKSPIAGLERKLAVSWITEPKSWNRSFTKS